MKKMKNKEVEQVLQVRGAQYGSYEDVSTLGNLLFDGWYKYLGAYRARVTPAMKTSVFMVCNKLARIHYGNNADTSSDSYIDIEGYLTLAGMSANTQVRLTIPQKELIRSLGIKHFAVLRIFAQTLRRINAQPRG